MASADATELVVVAEHGHVVELVLDRPEALNAISGALAERLAEACHELNRRGASHRGAGPRAAVLSSSNERAFCVGADLKERASFSDAQWLEQRPVLRALFDAVRAIEVPVVAAVAGYALGGGLELALSCDLIVADDTAQLGLPEAAVGLVPGGGGTQLVARRSGLAVAADLMFTARRVPAAEAFRLGLVDRLVPTGTARAAALELAGTVAGNSPVAVRAAKKALRLGAGTDLSTALEVEDAAWRVAAGSADRCEGVRAFIDKRAAVWPSTPKSPGDG